MNNNENRIVVIQFPTLTGGEISDGDNSIFVSEAINGFVLRSAVFQGLEEAERRNGIRHRSSVIEA